MLTFFARSFGRVAVGAVGAVGQPEAGPCHAEIVSMLSSLIAARL